MKAHNIFISWSGERSKLIADALHNWLPMVIQSAKPFMSSTSIDKGSRGLMELAAALDGIKVGISCLTPENLREPWILYEAGCLSKTVDDSTRLCTYLLGGLKNRDVEPPLGQFQHTSPSETETRQLVNTVNKALGGDDPLSEKTLDAIFERLWPVLEKDLLAFPSAPTEAPKRSPEDMLAEILEFTRSETNRRKIAFVQSAVTPRQSLAAYGPWRTHMGSVIYGDELVGLEAEQVTDTLTAIGRMKQAANEGSGTAKTTPRVDEGVPKS